MTLTPSYARLAAIGGAALLVVALVVGLLLTRASLATCNARLQVEQTKLAVSNDSIKALTNALAVQSAKVRALVATSDARQKASQDALRGAEEREKASAALVDRLRRSAAVAPAAGPCVVSEALAGVGDL